MTYRQTAVLPNGKIVKATYRKSMGRDAFVRVQGMTVSGELRPTNEGYQFIPRGVNAFLVTGK